jgi:PIN domain nuclease of toxin-antitoxin system
VNYLLDTHTILFSLFSPSKLGIRARDAILDPSSSVGVSVVSFWEISLKSSIGKLHLEGSSPDALPDACVQMGFSIVGLSAEDAASFDSLPRFGHKDPFDRMLVWQAIRQKRIMVSQDSAFRTYAASGLKVLW